MSPSTPERLQHSGYDSLKAKQERASMHNFLRRIAVVIASSLTWAVLVAAPASAESSVAAQNVVAISGIVTGNVDAALDTIREGTKKSSNVKVSVSPATVEPDAKTFTVFGWTSVSRAISHPYDLVFNVRQDNTTLSKHDAKAVWLGICEKAVQGDDIGKCDKDKDDQ
jgi:hypothetical protein